METEPHYERKAVVVRPAAGDDAEDLEDAIHDAVMASRDEAGRARASLVVLSLIALPEEVLPTWLKAAGPEIPDASLAIVVGEKYTHVARALGLTAFFPFYASLEEALRGGGQALRARSLSSASTLR